MHHLNHINEAAEYISKRVSTKPVIGLILGSGLGSFADTLENSIVIPYETIPHFAQSTAHGHANELVIGEISGKIVMAMKGRFHYYEGISLDGITFPVRVMQALGVKTLILTNAAGAINTNYKPGQLMLITDHINLTGKNPMIGPNSSELGVRFLDVSDLYTPALREIFSNTAKKMGLTLQKGVYAWLTGPSYETPAEVRMLRTLGADAVGMSTVPEALIACHGGMSVVGISCLTNMGAGILKQPLNHEEVIETAEKVKTSFLTLLREGIAQF